MHLVYLNENYDVVLSKELSFQEIIDRVTSEEGDGAVSVSLARDEQEGRSVSTIILSLVPSFTRQFFETMVTFENGEYEIAKFSTYGEAISFHNEACRRLFGHDGTIAYQGNLLPPAPAKNHDTDEPGLC